jgi:YcxB-like protein
MNEVTYNVEIADMKAFQRHHSRVSPQVRRLRIFLLLIFCALSLDSAIRHQTGSVGFRIVYFFALLGLMLVIGAALTFVANWIAQFRAYHNTDRNGVLGEHTITLTPEALHERTSVNDSKASWSGIFRIDATSTHLFIFTQPNAAHVIPRRAFPTTEAAEQFLSTARTYHAAVTFPVTASA